MMIDGLETPALLVDLDAMESNLATISEFYRNTRVKARPHFKNHGVLDFAARQVAAGAIGITVARVRHAEALVRHGIRSVLVANEIVDESSLRRLIDLSQRAEIILAVDNPEVISQVARLAGDAKSEFNVVIDLEVGLKRCGAPVSDALTLARAARNAGLRVRGLMGYEGHLQKLPPTEQTRRLRTDVADLLAQTRHRLEQDGFLVDIVTLGGTGTYEAYVECPAITEVQVGSYLLMDTFYQSYAPDFRLALTVLTRVVSKPSADRLVLDAGLKAISSEKGMPVIKSKTGFRVTALHAEHAVVEVQDTAGRVTVGDLLELWAYYSDATVHLHRTLYGVRTGAVEQAFAIEY
jgi:D-serine deaminase-like pyridoxal phosphate-dependent protein